MVRGQVIEYNRNFFSKTFVKNETERVLPDLFLFFKKLYMNKCKRSAAWLHYISMVLKLVYNKEQTA